MPPEPGYAAEIPRLSSELKAQLGDVRFDRGARALYATDASNYRQVPLGVVAPRSRDELITAIGLCREAAVPILCRGGGTSLAGQCCNEAVVLDVSKHLNHILEIDAERRTARVEPGVVLDDLRNEAERYGLTFAPDPATHDHATIGGMIGNNSCGVHSIMGGRTADNVAELEVITYDGVRLRVGATSEATVAEYVRAGGRRGEIYAGMRNLALRYSSEIRERYPNIPRRVSGYNLDELLPERGFNVARALVGTECTCAVVLEATVQLVPSPEVRALLILGFEDIFHAADLVPRVMEQKPIALEGIDEGLVEDVRRRGLGTGGIDKLPEGKGWLLAEFGAGTGVAAQECAERACRALREEVPDISARVLTGRQSRTVWRIRESALGATAHVSQKADTAPGWEDAAVPPAKLGAYLREFSTLLERYGYHGDLYGHFGQGCVHTRIDFDLRSGTGRERFKKFLDAAADLVLEHGGSLSGEHGDGQARGKLLEKMYGSTLVAAFQEFKALWDPDDRMNPGKVVRPAGPLEHLRLAQAVEAPRTEFAFPDDAGSFPWALRRCVGVGECRKTNGGTMCPSYMATREEEHSTRGRAHLLYEMLLGDVIEDSWRSREVKDALELCLACKACRSECPVNVDMATYKAEFLSHYYDGRRRPREAYAFGLIDRWARVGAALPSVFNAAIANGLLSKIVKWAAGIAEQRSLPRLAGESFRQWQKKQPLPDRAPRGPVILWADTFNNYFTPSVARAAYRVLRRLGYTPIVPQPACCGRPAYGFGMLDRARHHGRRTLSSLCAERDDLPIVVLEPSCAAVLTDELPNLLAGDPRARDVAGRTVLFSDFLGQRDLGHALHFDEPVIMHPHCHQRALFGVNGECRALEKMGADYRLLDAGCCGMAGSYGFERGKYDISKRLAERVLLPEIRAMSRRTVVLADGYACREQIRQLSGSCALHLAELAALAMEGDSP